MNIAKIDLLTTSAYKIRKPSPNPSFKGNIFNSIQDVFVKKAPVVKFTPEQEDDADIRDLLNDIDMIAAKYKKHAKEGKKMIKILLEIGKLNNYTKYAPYKDDSKLMFSNYDEKTGIPKKIDIISFNNNRIEFKNSYEYQDKNNYRIKNYVSSDSYIETVVENNALKDMYDYDIENNSFQHAEFFKNAIKYTISSLDKNQNPDEIIVYINYDFKDADKCYYIEQDNDKNYIMFTYDKDMDMWRVTKQIPACEISQYIQ